MLHQRLEQQAYEPCHKKIDEGRHDEGKEGIEGARADEVGGTCHVGHGDVAHDACAFQQTDDLALIDGHDRPDDLWKNNAEECLPLCVAQGQTRFGLPTVDALNGGT